MNARPVSARPRLLLAAGLVLILIFQALHFADVLGLTRGNFLFSISELIRANVTPLAWCAYLIFLLGMLSFLDRASYIGRYRNRFAVCWLWSVPAWCYFDWMNFYYMRDPSTGLRAWEYINLPTDFGDRLLGYLLAFGAIAPGMFLTAEVLQRLGFRKFIRETPAVRVQRTWFVVPALVIGVVLAPIPILVGTPGSNLAIWIGTWALLDPLNWLCNRPSILRDWSEGRFGRTLALGAGGLICGFLWEFWNYWSYTKWIYHLPFLGAWEHYKYFEMPVPGLVGFIAFGIETWTMWQTALLILSPFVEGERGGEQDAALRTDGCI